VKPGRHGYNAYAKVIESTISEIKRVDGTNVQLAEGKLGDASGIINFRILGDYASIMKPNVVVAIRNGRSEVPKGHQRLELDRWGKITEESTEKVANVN
jgi:hypothetical protein